MRGDYKMKNKLFLLVIASCLLVGCGTKKANEEAKTEDTPTNTTPVETKTVTYTFLNNAEQFPTGDLSKETTRESFTAGFNKDENLVSSVSVTGYVQVLSMNDDACYIKSALLLGSKSYAGELTINFSVTVKQVRLETQAYWKSYSYNGVNYNVDTASSLYVQSDENVIDLSCKEGEEPATHNDVFSVNSNSLKLYNKETAKRVYIHSMTIYY